MREILFRGKRPNGCWVQGDLTQFCIDGVKTSKISNHDLRATLNGLRVSTYTNEVAPDTVGQYTGLTDKNGTKIFEGDIVNFKTTAYYFKNCRIKYQSCYGRYCAIDNHGYEYPMDKTFKYEVIGNIHDNPELLERSNNND